MPGHSTATLSLSARPRRRRWTGTRESCSFTIEASGAGAGGTNPPTVTGDYDDYSYGWLPIGGGSVLAAGVAVVAFLLLQGGGGNNRGALPPEGATDVRVQMDKVYFQSTRDTPDHEELYVVNADGSNLQRLTTTPQSATPGEPARSSRLADASSDGRSIVFSSNRDGGTSELYVMAADGSNVRQIPISPPGDKLEPNLSVDGKRVVFEVKTTANGIDNYDVYVANLDGSGLQDLTNEPATDIDPYWSPDGRQIVFASDREDADMEVWVMNSDGSNKRRLTHGPGFDAEPAWSPDGQHIAFESNRQGSNGFDIYVMDPNGANPTRVVSEPTDDFDPAWARSSQQIAFTAGSGSSFDVEVVGLDGSFENLTNGQGSSGKPAFSPKRNFLQQ